MISFLLKIRSKRCSPLVGAAFLLIFVSFFAMRLQTVSAATVIPRFEISGDPGQVLAGSVKLYNEEKSSKTYFISFQNFLSQDELGNPTFTERKEDLATWLVGPETITIGSGQALDVPIKIYIPRNADHGGHFAAVFFQTNPPNSKEPGQLGLSAKLGSLVLLTVNGNFVQGATIIDFATKAHQRIFTYLPVSFYYRFQNTGENYLKPVGDVIISNTIGRSTKILPANPIDGGVLPKSIRRFETVWTHNLASADDKVNPTLPVAPKGFWDTVKYQWQNFALGKYTATLKVVYGSKQLMSSNASYTFYVIPWQLLLVIIIGAIIAFIVGRFTLGRYDRRVIAQAKKKAAV